MGLTCRELLTVLLSLAPDAKCDMMPIPGIACDDMPCRMRKTSHLTLTLDEWFDVLFAPIIRELKRCKQLKYVLCCLEKGVPAIKADTIRARDKIASQDEEAGKVLPSGAKIPSSKPYSDTTQITSRGDFLMMKRHGGNCYLVERAERKINIGRLLNSRKLRQKAFIYMFTKRAPLIRELIPPGKMIVIDYSTNLNLSPLILRNALEPAESPALKHQLANTWVEADWAMPHGMRVLVHLFQREFPGEPCNILAWSVDGDMFGIFALFVSHMCAKIKDFNVFFWNMNKTERGQVTDMQKFVAGMRRNHGVTPDQLVVFKFCTGNDYCEHKLLTPHLGSLAMWPAFTAYVRPYLMPPPSWKAPMLTDNLQSFKKLLDVLHRSVKTDTIAAKVRKAVAEVTDEQLADQLVRLKAGVAAWTNCFMKSGPDLDEPLLWMVGGSDSTDYKALFDSEKADVKIADLSPTPPPSCESASGLAFLEKWEYKDITFYSGNKLSMFVTLPPDERNRMAELTYGLFSSLSVIKSPKHAANMWLWLTSQFEVADAWKCFSAKATTD